MAPKKKDPNFLSDIKKGTLHKALGYKPDEKIPESKINALANSNVGDTIKTKQGETKKISLEMKRKGVFAKNARKFKH